MSIISNIKQMLLGRKLYTLLVIITTFNIVYFTLRGEYYLNVVFVFSFFLSFLLYRVINKTIKPHITFVLFVSNATTYLVKYFMTLRIRKPMIIEGADGTSGVAVGMDSDSIKDSIDQQEQQKKDLVSQINQIYLDNAAQIASLQKTLNDAQTMQAQQGSTST